MQRRFLLPAACLIVLLGGCGGSRDPFSYVKVAGKVTYEDGSKLPVIVQLRFYPQAPPLDEKTYPRVGSAVTNADGEYRDVAVVTGKHKVTLSTAKGKRRSLEAVPPEYSDPDKTPLLLDTADPATFNLKIAKPKK